MWPTHSGRVVEVPLPLQVDSFPEFEVDSILDSRFRRRKLHYLVDWVGYDESERTWEPATNITNAAKAVSDFHKTFPSKPSLSSSAIQFAMYIQNISKILFSVSFLFVAQLFFVFMLFSVVSGVPSTPFNGVVLLGPLPMVTSASLVSVLNPH